MFIINNLTKSWIKGLRKQLLTDPDLTLNKLAEIPSTNSQIQEKNEILSQIAQSLHKRTLQKQQQDKLKHQQKQQQAQHYQQKRLFLMWAKGHQAEIKNTIPVAS